MPQDGVASNHHFLLPKDGSEFRFQEGNYKLHVWAKLVGDASSNLLTAIDLNISHSQAKALNDPSTGLFFDWGPDQQSYHSHIDNRKLPETSMDQIIGLLSEESKQPSISE